MWCGRLVLFMLSLVMFESEGLFFNLFKKNRGVQSSKPSYYPGNSNNVKPSKPTYTPPLGHWRPVNQNQVQPSYHPPKGNSFSKPKRKYKWDILGIFGSKKPNLNGYRPAYKPLYNYNTPGHRPNRPQGGYSPPNQGNKPGYLPPSQGNNHQGYQPPGQGNNNQGYPTPCQTAKPGYTPPQGRPQNQGNFHQGNRPSYPQQPAASAHPQNGYLPPNPNPATYFPTLPTQAPPVIFPSDDGYGSPQASVIGQPLNHGNVQNNNFIHNNNNNIDGGVNFGISQPASTGYGSPQAPVLGQAFPAQSFQPPNQAFSVPNNVPSTFNPPLTSNVNPSSQAATGSLVSQSSNGIPPTQPSAIQPNTNYGSPLGSVITSELTPELALDIADDGGLPLGSIANSINNPPSQSLTLQTPIVVEAVRSGIQDIEGGEPLAELSSFGDEWVPMTMAKIMEMFSLPQKSDANSAQSRDNQSGPQVVLVQDTVQNPFTKIGEKQVARGQNNLSKVIIKVNKEEIEDVATLEPPYSVKEVRQTVTKADTTTTTEKVTKSEPESLIIEEVPEEESNSDPPPTPSPLMGTTTWIVGQNKTIEEPTPEEAKESETEVPPLEKVQVDEEKEQSVRDGKSLDPNRIGLLPDLTDLDNSPERNAIHGNENEIPDLRESLNKVPYSALAMSPTASPTPSSLNTFVSLVMDEVIPREETTPTSKQTYPKSILEILHVIDKEEEPFEPDNFVHDHEHDLDFGILQDPEKPTVEYEYYTDFASHPNDDALDPATINDNAFFNVLREDKNEKWVWADKDFTADQKSTTATTTTTTSSTTTATTTITTGITTTTTTTTTMTTSTTTTTTTTTLTKLVTTTTTTQFSTTTLATTSHSITSFSTPTSESTSSEDSISPTESVDESPTLIPMTESPVVWISDPAVDFGEETNSIPDDKNSPTRSLRTRIQSTSEGVPPLEEQNVIDSKPNLLVSGPKNTAPLVWYYPIHGKPFRSFIPSVKYSSISG